MFLLCRYTLDLSSSGHHLVGFSGLLSNGHDSESSSSGDGGDGIVGVVSEDDEDGNGDFVLGLSSEGRPADNGEGQVLSGVPCPLNISKYLFSLSLSLSLSLSISS